MPTTRRPLLTPAGHYDRSAITSAAWAMARAAVAPIPASRGYTPPPLPTLRQAFAAGMRRAWDLARGQKASREHFAAMQAEDARRSALSGVEREVLALRDARILAPMIDSERRMVAELAMVSARAATLGVRL